MSTVQYRNPPVFEQPIMTKDATNASWYRYFTQNEKGTPPSSETVLTVGASPYTYTAPAKGFVILSGGTVSGVTFSRTKGTTYTAGQTSGMFPLAQNDVLVVTYSVKPSMVWVPT